ncbi:MULTISPECIES: riboflavin synthase [Lactobacillus]|uniref:Riboflavin synthase n=1 Tax=Lactobacillus xujianguonis TaxID=2495899 RepID=A0A437SY43_9LACO|nr:MULTISPECIES: riboflavin synthase [Lactobacillus]RVU71849.1 riboflavin synthase [Lactobacillus xujianguonis]RVU77625.1 riboflavin synthase [Lactobacillus xujianguonis]
MFSGLVRGDAHIAQINQDKETITLTVKCALDFIKDLKIGDSIAINGTCLTAESFTNDTFTVTMMPQTYKKTIFKDLKVGDQLNVERSLQVGQRLEGHIVTGHIDDIAQVKTVNQNENAIEIWFNFPTRLEKQIVPQGSIAINGVSLTVMDTKENNFSVGLIPHTQDETNLVQLKVGSKVNIETDILGKYVAKNLEKRV